MIFLDTEFNGFQGPLISMALVAEDEYFYEVLPLPKTIHPWVEKHVVPKLARPAVTPARFKSLLWQFMAERQGETVVADWPEDFAHLMNWMCEPEGKSPKLEFKMHLLNSGELSPLTPHNALSDAMALKAWYEITHA